MIMVSDFTTIEIIAREGNLVMKSIVACLGEIFTEVKHFVSLNIAVGDVTDLDWERLVLSAGSTVVVGFWARWSGPSLPILPIFDEVAQEYSGRLNCYKLEVDENPSTATRYPARTLPTFIIFKNGERKDTVIGAVPKTTLTSTIEKYL
ncbi:uncharacterized protein [Phaseolus vulgaris]|uniref:uncharacterized protein n=1 Tax=Phaseolus vulgaris TaxID=3885 RepID=UPI0035C9F29E